MAIPVSVTVNKPQNIQPFKVVVVDDSPSMRRWLSSVISQDSRLRVVGTAGTAEEARDIIKETNPDVLTLDIEMPGIDGLEFLAHLMRLRPMPVVMLAGGIEGKSPCARKALEIGAAACLAKPNYPTKASIKELCEVLLNAASGQLPATHKTDVKAPKSCDKILLVGASTGGVTAIETLVENLPYDTPPVVIAQHMPQNFLERFVNRLDRRASHNVSFAWEGMQLEPGSIHISPSLGVQTGVAWRKGSWHIRQVEPRGDHLFCPSVDVLFTSGVPWASQVGAVILTGLGSDGAQGMLELRQNGASTIGQSKESCAVYGMPGAAHSLNACEDQAPIGKIASKILARLTEKTPNKVTP